MWVLSAAHRGCAAVGWEDGACCLFVRTCTRGDAPVLRHVGVELADHFCSIGGCVCGSGLVATVVCCCAGGELRDVRAHRVGESWVYGDDG
jgi:hypothetical protein